MTITRIYIPYIHFTNGGLVSRVELESPIMPELYHIRSKLKYIKFDDLDYRYPPPKLSLYWRIRFWLRDQFWIFRIEV